MAGVGPRRPTVSEGLLPRGVDRLDQVTAGRLELGQFRVASAQPARPQISDEAVAGVSPAEDPEVRLKPARISGATGHEHSPRPDPELVQGALELLQRPLRKVLVSKAVLERIQG